MEELKSALRAAFGDSSESESEEEGLYHNIIVRENLDRVFEKVEGINGLWICTEFLCAHNQISLLRDIQREGWFSEISHNQAMRFGDLPGWAIELSRIISEAANLYAFDCGTCRLLNDCSQHREKGLPFPRSLLRREPLFDQMIVNVYQPGEGICSHVDLLRFEDGIAIISLESDCVMHFTPSLDDVPSIDKSGDGPGDFSSSRKVPVLLKPGSLVLMSGEARYLWKHEINRRPGFQVWEGKEIDQRKRTSVTLRRLCITNETPNLHSS